VWIIKERHCISPEVTVKGFKECCVSTAVDDTDEDVLWNGNEVAGNIRSGCEVDEGAECEDGDIDTDW
jgi:hypothetical protein